MNDTKVRMILGFAGLVFLTVVFGRRKTEPRFVSRKEDVRGLARLTLFDLADQYDSVGDGGELARPVYKEGA